MEWEQLTKEELIEYLESLKEEQSGKLGLMWDREKVPEKIVEECDEFVPVLKENLEKSIISDKSIENIFIEGDNFHSLSVLNYTHGESVDVIYIDPPYNTGNKDFMYNDKFVDSDDGYKHSKWLNFMEKRLKLAKNLLKDNGIIFISIDDNEYSQLKLLCDRIFGSSRFIANFIRKTSYGEKTAKPKVNRHHDYCLCYCKKYEAIIDKEVLGGEEKEFRDYSNPDNDPRGEWKKDSYLIKIDTGRYGYARYPIYNPYLDITHYPPVYYNEEDRKQWHYTEDKFKEMERNGQVVYYKTKEEMGNNKYSFYIKKYRDSISDLRSNVSTTLFDTNEYVNGNGSKDLTNVIGKGKSIIGMYPKPVKFIKQLLKFSTCYNKNALILDFFAGSATTAQAVLELNNEDGGNRRFIICTNNESNICEDFAYPRCKTILTGKRNDGSEYSKSVKANLRYFNTDFVKNDGTRDQLYFDLTEKCIPMLCAKESTHVLVEKNDEYVIYKNQEGNKYTCVYFDMFGSNYDEFISKIEKIPEYKFLYIFSLNDYVEQNELMNVEHYELESIPSKILELYKKVAQVKREE